MGIFFKHKLVVKYVITGVSAGVLDLGLLFVFKEYFHVWYITSAVLAWAFSFSTAFVAQKYWTFGDFSDDNIHGQFFWYFFTVICSLLLNLMILSSLVEFANINYVLAQAVSLCITGMIGFVMNVRNVFSRTHNDNGVVIAAGIYPPEIGGPASHIHRLAKELSVRGVNVSVVTYAKVVNGNQGEGYDITRIPSGLPTLIRGAAYLVFLFISSVKHPNIFAQDVTSTGLPAMIIKKILPHKKLIIRIGGDLLWERDVESGNTKLSLVDYYISGVHKAQRLFKLGKFVMSVADEIIVPADFLREIYVRYYGISVDKIRVIRNPIPAIGIYLEAKPLNKSSGIEKNIIFAGRFLKLKNVDALIRAFIAIYPEIKPARLLLIGDGLEKQHYFKMINSSALKDLISVISTLSQRELFSQIGIADLCVCPSLSEVNSNFTLECLAIGKPVLLTKHNGLSIKLPEEMLFAYDDQTELEDKIKFLLSGKYNVSELQKLVASEAVKNSWDEVVEKYLKIFNL